MYFRAGPLAYPRRRCDDALIGTRYVVAWSEHTMVIGGSRSASKTCFPVSKDDQSLEETIMTRLRTEPRASSSEGGGFLAVRLA